MATTFTRLDVEDVLSSIRKLVSDVGPERGLNGGSSAEPLFLLTPAHRIAEDTSRMTLSAPSSSSEHDAQDQEVGALHGETGDSGPLHLGTPVFVRAKMTSEGVDTGHPAAQGNDGQALQDTAADPSNAADQPDRAEALPEAQQPAGQEPAFDETEDPFAQAALNSGSLEMRAAELEVAVSQENEQWEPDGSEAEPTGFPALAFLAKYREHALKSSDNSTPDQLDEGEVSAFVSTAFGRDKGAKPLEQPGSDDPQTAPESQVAIDETGPGDDLTEAATGRAEQHFDDAASLEDSIDAQEIALEALTKVILDEPEKPTEESASADNQEELSPDDLSDAEAIDHILKSDAAQDAGLAQADAGSEPDQHDIAPEIAAIDQSAEAQTTERPMPVVIAFDDGDDDEFDEPEIWSSDDDLLVDEDVLRRVVADIVRDELQGRLGERITRNVRRMVRREIEKALSTRHLE